MLLEETWNGGISEEPTFELHASESKLEHLLLRWLRVFT